MNCRVLTYSDINRDQWSALVLTSATGTWFQLPQAYDLFASLPSVFAPFAVAVVSPKKEAGTPPHETRGWSAEELRGVCIGYVTLEQSAIRQFFTRRAIIIGGPTLADDATDEEVSALLCAVNRSLLSRKAGVGLSPIYIEIRNFNDYCHWRTAFVAAGFNYQPHLNFHVDCTDLDAMWNRLSANRRRQIRKQSAQTLQESIATSAVTEQDVREWYAILHQLYCTKVRTPLWPVEFFLNAYRQGVGRFVLVRYNGKIIGGSMLVVKPTITPTSTAIAPDRTSTGGVAYEWYECGLNTEYKDQCPSVMTTYADMLYAHEQGCAYYDMMGAGVPDKPYGVRDFKQRFGGRLVEYGRWLYVARPLLYGIGQMGVALLRKHSV